MSDDNNAAKDVTKARRGVLYHILGFLHHHPVICCIIMAIGAPIFILAALWSYFHVTTQQQVAERLHSMGLPANGLELETWHLPAGDGSAELKRAMQLVENIYGGFSDEVSEKITTPDDLDYKSIQTELEALAQALVPLRQLLAKANKHEVLLWGFQTRNGFNTNVSPVMQFRIYTLLNSKLALYRIWRGEDIDAVLDGIITDMELNNKIQGRCLIEYLVKIAVNGIQLKLLNQIVEMDGITNEQLKRIRAATDYSRLRADRINSQRHAFVGEICWINSFMDSVGVFDDPAELDMPKYFVHSFFVREFNRKEIVDEYLALYDMLDKDYPQIKNYLSVKEAEANDRENSRLYLAYAFLNFYSEIFAVNSGLVANSIGCGFYTEAQLLQLKVATELVELELEGKPWPQDLSDTRWPRDPFTHQPFRLTLTPEAAYIVSAGKDMKMSGKEKEFDKTGQMTYAGLASTGEDDLVFRLARRVRSKYPQSGKHTGENMNE